MFASFINRGDAEDAEFLEIENNASDACFQENSVKVQQQTQFAVCQFEVSNCLSFM